MLNIFELKTVWKNSSKFNRNFNLVEFENKNSYFSKSNNKKKSFCKFRTCQMYCVFPDVINAFQMKILFLSNSKNNKGVILKFVEYFF